MTGYLTTHVLDTASGSPAAGLTITLWRVGEVTTQLKRLTTNADGRTDTPLLQGADFASGIYELRFEVGDYFRARATDLPDPLFLDVVPLRFGIADAEVHYHVPLLCSPWSYSTYRGS
ncbi:MAG: hydroxyisourate hydrolase [Cyanobacteria bacterium J06632_22]